MRSRRVQVLSVAVAAAVIVALGGCSSSAGTGAADAVAAGADGNGIEKETAAEIVAASKAAAEAAAEVHITGTADGTDIDARLALDVGDVKLVHNGEHVEVMRVGSDHYLMGDTAFWTDAASATAAAKLAGQWVKLTAEQAKAYEKFLSVPTFFAGMYQSSGTPTKGDVGTVDGVKTIALTDTDGSKLYIATTGKPYPVKVANAGTSGDQVTLTEWNLPITGVTAPPAGSVIDPSTPTGG